MFQHISNILSFIFEIVIVIGGTYGRFWKVLQFYTSNAMHYKADHQKRKQIIAIRI